MPKTLATFGCSWTAGVGASYNSTVPDEETYKKYAWDSDMNYPNSFRGILCNRFNLGNFNVSKGGASNDYNFETASSIFGNEQKRKEFLDSDPLVLWGITSTARLYRNGESIFLNHNREESIGYFLDDEYAKNPSLDDLKYILGNHEYLYSALHLKMYYNHDTEVLRLANLIQNWNVIFEFYKIPVIWFDTFNTHNYYNNPDNFIKGDLLSRMLEYKKIKYRKNKKWYHLSDWTNDDPRITAGVKNKLLNPYSYHPSAKGHSVIADILSPSIREKIDTF